MSCACPITVRVGVPVRYTSCGLPLRMVDISKLYCVGINGEFETEQFVHFLYRKTVATLQPELRYVKRAARASSRHVP